ncbi:macro domain-containing protein, partial [Streptococcus pyogenes]|uniref:macro domain-containing protein n=1 Tax=Streptococcus pyogenes TaxID=1314 RepID=UPI003DA0EDA1
CFTRSLDVAAELGARSVAFPAVSAGVYGWAADDVARIAVDAVRGWGGWGEPDATPARGTAPLAEVRFVLFSAALLAAFEARLGR